MEQVAAQAVGAVQRARALFGPSVRPPASGEPTLQSAAQTVRATGDHAAVLSGELARQHDCVVNDAATRLAGDGHSDTRLHQTLRAAALFHQTGTAQLDAIADRTRILAAAAPAARSPAAQRALLHGLRAQVFAANAVVDTTEERSRATAGDIRALDYQPSGRAQDAGFSADPPPQAPPPPDPPHGKDPRYWIDVTRIIRVPEGAMAPYGSKQIGPGLWYPIDNGMSQPGPPAAKYPLDLSRLIRLAPGQLGPYNTTELVPGVYTPDPRRIAGAAPKWPAPQQPVDIRDVIHVPPGQLAPWNYVEYLPGWFTPRPPDPLR